MKAYAILSGGGVKGAALAGCVAAAVEQGIEFEGFGGTSAGSIIALLAASGYTNEADLNLIAVRELEFSALLDDGGKRLQHARSAVDSVLAPAGWRRPRQSCKKLLAAMAMRNQLKQGGLGLYRGDKLQRFFFEKVSAKLPTLSGNSDFTFKDFARAGGKPLKVVATDLRSRRAKEFSIETTPDFPVLLAVRASAGFPFLFRPVDSAQHLLVDGGLASNFPVFLFSGEYQKNRIPILAFNLVTPQPDFADKPRPRQFLQDMLATALEAGDALMQENLPGIELIKVMLKSGVDTLDFNADENARHTLYLEGKDAANQFLHAYPPLLHSRMAGTDLVKRLWSIYGPQYYYAPVLASVCREIEGISNARDVRASIMLPTGRVSGSRIVVYDHGMEGCYDQKLELPEDGGCSGQALKSKEGMAMDDLCKAREDPVSRNLTPDIMRMMPKDRCSIASIVIPGWVRFSEMEDGGVNFPQLPRIGVLSVDSSTPFSETGWDRDNQDEFVNRLRTWAYILGRMLP